MMTRLRSGWTVVALMCLAVLAIWLPDLDLPLGNSDDGRILARNGLSARNFWELGAAESRFGAVIEPFIRSEYGVAPRSEPPAAAVTYAHHPPLQTFVTILSFAALGDTLATLRLAGFCMGAATVAFMAFLLRTRGLSWGSTLLALAAMASTGFFYVYARIGVGYSLLVAATAAVAWLRERQNPPRWALAATALVAALAALQSWIALATLGLLVLWLFSGTLRDARLRRSQPANHVSPADSPTETLHGRHPLKPQPTSHAHTADPTTSTLHHHHPLKPQTASHAHTADPTTSTLHHQHPLKPQTASHAHTADPTTSTLHHQHPLKPQTASHANPSGATASTLHRLRGWLASGYSPALGALIAGAAVGTAITAAWLLNATDVAELGERTAFRIGSDVSTAIEQRQFSFSEFLARQWQFASHELMTPLWLRLLLVPALLAGVLDRRTRAPLLITLTFAATLTFGFQQGAWIHRLWNFPWLAPVTIGLAALADAARRALSGPAVRLRLPAGLLAGGLAAATLIAVVSGPTRDFYLTDPAEAGAVLEQVQNSHTPEVVWHTPGISTARWVSYYLKAPVFALDEELLDEVAPGDLVLLRSDRIPDYIPDEALRSPLAQNEAYMVIDAAMLLP